MRPVMNRSESFIEKYEDPAGDGNQSVRVREPLLTLIEKYEDPAGDGN